MTNEDDKDMRARRAQKALKRRVTYEIMHMDKRGRPVKFER